jgi:hydrogenase large subunit
VTRLVVGPFNRVEGDLEVTLDIADGVVQAAYANSPLFRGFEQILQGKDPLDALVFVPRVCGICSVSQSCAAAAALADANGVVLPPNGQLATALILANENLADHLSHFYLFFMPDFAREAYCGRPWFEHALRRFEAMQGEAAREVLPARAAFLELMGFLAGKWPHTLAIQPGGSSRPVTASEKIRVYALLRQFRGFLESVLFGDSLEAVAALDSEAALRAWRDARPVQAGDFRFFLHVAEDLALERLGRATDVFLSYGNYALPEGKLFGAGVWDGAVHPLQPDAIAEDLSHAWMAGEPAVQRPQEGMTLPDMDKPGAYSWCKAPRWNGRVCETGALARQVVHGHPLVRALVAEQGGNVCNRVIARLLELALVVPEMEKWVQALRIGEPFCSHAPMPPQARGVGLVESARGALGHWLDVHGGRIRNYQIVAPTTWNFSPRDRDGVPGALEQALVGAPVGDGEETPLAVQHIVRSFDPCMVCTVH